MPQDFVFGLAVCGRISREMLQALTARVLEHVGFADDGAQTLAADLDAAIARGAGAGGRRVDVRFQTRDGRLHIVVSSSAGEIWRAAREIP